MGNVSVSLSEELENEFRKAVFKRYGLKKGDISKALEEAIKDWIKKA